MILPPSIYLENDSAAGTGFDSVTALAFDPSTGAVTQIGTELELGVEPAGYGGCSSAAFVHERTRRLFVTDPAGNLIELHQQDSCRCTARARSGLGQARVSGTVLFADMRGFTSVAERLTPAEVVPLLNEYFSMLSGVTQEHGGAVFHMAGDGLMAGFGLPNPSDDASGRPITCAADDARRVTIGSGRS